MQIFIKTNGSSRSVDVSLSTTVAALKSSLAPVGVDVFRAVFAGRDLNDDAELSRVGVTTGATVTMIPRVLGGMPTPASNSADTAAAPAPAPAAPPAAPAASVDNTGMPPAGGPTGAAGAPGAPGAAGAGPAAAAAAFTGPQFRSASLYVGDLDPEVTESQLFEVFNAVAPVASIRVCRHAVTRQSLGYAYVNFHSQGDAERVLDTMNYFPIKNRPCRIMWSQRDPTARRSGVGNIFIKNLAPSIDSKDLHDTFSLFGNILSCKVACDIEGNSKGYGFVHFETRESAESAIEKVNNMEIAGRAVSVQPYVAPAHRNKNTEWTNVYVKNIPREWSVDTLNRLFEEHGEIQSSIIVEKDGVSRGFGFVCFKEPAAAKAAVEALNGHEVEHREPKAKASADGETKADGETESKAEGDSEEMVTVKKQLYVGRAQKAEERRRMLAQQIEESRVERIKQWQGLNLYVRNLDESIDEEELAREFSAFGTITSTRVARDADGRSKLFGYVCFNQQDDAAKAVLGMNSRVVKGKPLYVAMWQPKELRRAALQAQIQQRQAAASMYGAGGSFPAAAGRGMPGGPFVGTDGGIYFAAGPSRAGYPAAFNMARAAGMHGPAGAAGMQPGFSGPGAAGMPRNFAGYPMPMSMMAGMHGSLAPAGRGGMRRGGPQYPAGQGGGRGRNNRRGGRGGAQGGQSGMQYREHARNVNMSAEGEAAGAQPAVPVPQAAPAAPPSGPEPLAPEVLARATPAEQKHMIGERLYMLISESQPTLAAKLTGMLLDGMDSSELLHLLESPDMLRARVKEAMDVLEQHHRRQKEEEAAAAAAPATAGGEI